MPRTRAMREQEVPPPSEFSHECSWACWQKQDMPSTSKVRMTGDGQIRSPRRRLSVCRPTGKWLARSRACTSRPTRTGISWDQFGLKILGNIIAGISDWNIYN
mmetsp:Transcript_15262/g.30831  ORF Transcript_15262/g.30831 Transcript_15262/m.30831 type:complete len:103 (+) Transcript_15262:213-521(+)